MFTSENLCIYGGVEFDRWQGDGHPIPATVNNPFGPDNQPGIAGVDDDGDFLIDDIGLGGEDDDNDGTTDEPGEAAVDEDESHAIRPTQANRGYGNLDGTGFKAGVDNAPGVSGVDDDSNGITDDINELGWPLTDDGDDEPGLMEWTVWIRMNLPLARGIALSLVPGGEEEVMARIVENSGDLLVADPLPLESANEITIGFYDAFTHYNYQFCVSGTCYGAVLWTRGDMAHPNETLGPVISTFHPPATNNVLALGNGVIRLDDPVIRNVYTRLHAWRGNTNFSQKFWVVSGDPMSADFTNGIFGYPSPSSDLDGDRDVDANDFLTFSNCFAGSLIRPNPLCFPPNLTTCGGGQNAMGGGGLLLTQSSIAFEQFIANGMNPAEDVWYLYKPTCTGDAELALCDITGQSRSNDGIHFAFFDGTSEEATVVPATACGQSSTETVPVVAGQTVYLLVYRDAGAKSLDGFTLSVTCGQ